MSSIDDTYEYMLHFRSSLAAFSETLAASIYDMHTKYQAVELDWANDQAQRTYRAHWQPLEAILEHFLKQEAPAYDQFLEQKLYALDRYLRG